MNTWTKDSRGGWFAFSCSLATSHLGQGRLAWLTFALLNRLISTFPWLDCERFARPSRFVLLVDNHSLLKGLAKSVFTLWSVSCASYMSSWMVVCNYWLNFVPPESVNTSIQQQGVPPFRFSLFRSNAPISHEAHHHFHIVDYFVTSPHPPLPRACLSINCWWKPSFTSLVTDKTGRAGG